MTVVASLSSANSKEGGVHVCGRGVGKGHCISPRATIRLGRRLAGSSALHHLLGLLLSHAALSYRLEQPERRTGKHLQNILGAVIYNHLHMLEDKEIR